jgi:hypothetical protein
LIITVLLVLLALLSATSVLTSRNGFARPAGVANNPTLQGTNGAAGTGSTQGNGAGNFQANNGATGAARTGGANRGGFNTFTLFRSVGLGGQTMLYVTLGATILGILIALVSAFGVWKQKSWGLNLGIAIAILFLASALPGLFSLGGRNVNLLRTSLTVLTLVASAPILVFGILPSTRDLVTAS